MRVEPTVYVSDDGKRFDTEAECLTHEALMQELGLKQWKFTMFFRSELREEFRPRYKTCTSCGGRGKVGGHFHSLDGEEDCPAYCINGQVIDNENSLPHVNAPRMPEELRELMSKTWNNWWAGFYNRKTQ